jgi:hypothetical protein
MNFGCVRERIPAEGAAVQSVSCGGSSGKLTGGPKEPLGRRPETGGGRGPSTQGPGQLSQGLCLLCLVNGNTAEVLYFQIPDCCVENELQ